MKFNLLLLILLPVLWGCSKDDDAGKSGLYFPPASSAQWETTDPASLGWDVTLLPQLYSMLETNGTRAFIVLKDGRIVLEKYFSTTFTGSRFTSSSSWYWASAGKTLTAFVAGKAQEEGYLSISDKTSGYLGTGWTSLLPAQEGKITVRNQLTMTTGLDDGVADNHSFDPADLVYKADAGTRWAYHNAPYTLLDQVIENATGEIFDNYFKNVLRDRIGMDGVWLWTDNDHVYYSTARSMARFGLLILGKGVWGKEVIMEDGDYFSDMISPSQSLNKSYGYLWWLNGKESFMAPGSQLVIPGSITPSAPSDMFSGMGKNGQFVSVVPSQGIVMVRMGENPSDVPVPFLFLEDIWEILATVIR
ncbi:MAG: serine hydrolase domain-containing protein [Bacteroidota bacterium]|nr:serine hydrolase domain-containing protein [Bacteroidota bacterium]